MTWMLDHRKGWWVCFGRSAGLRQDRLRLGSLLQRLEARLKKDTHSQDGPWDVGFAIWLWLKTSGSHHFGVFGVRTYFSGDWDVFDPWPYGYGSKLNHQDMDRRF